MKIALSSDHAGYPLKQHLVEYLSSKGHEVLDLGVDTDAVSSDYTDAALRVGHAVVKGEVERGLLVCGSGVGASIAANKMKGVYCAIAHDTYTAAQGVEHDNMNVLALGARVIGVATGEALADAFLGATFNTTTERYGRRFRQLLEIEESGE
jgi:ribose 5-phosphate isomerase B